MTIRVDNCAKCGNAFEQELKQGRPRSLCADCAPKPAGKKSEPVEPGLKPDPPVRADGRCAVCPKKRVITKASRKYAGAQIDADPFCSSRCCRAFHGCPVSGDDGENDAQIEAARLLNEERKAAKGIAA